MAAAVAPATAFACRQEVPRDSDLIAYREAFVVAVRQAERHPNPSRSAWIVQGEVKQIIAGSPPAQTLTFTATNGTCPTPEPKSGERWVLYLNEPVDGFQHWPPTQAFPLSYVGAIDPRLADAH